MATKEIVRSEPIDTKRVLVPAGATVTLYNSKWSANIEKYIRRIKAYAPKDTIIDYFDANGNLLNVDAEDIGSFPHDYQVPVSLNKGGSLIIKARHPYAVSKYVQVKVDLIRHTFTETGCGV